MWNYEVQKDELLRFKYFQQSKWQPIIFQDKIKDTHPVIVVNQKVHKMLQLDEFLNRLVEGQKLQKLNYRQCASLEEQDNLRTLKKVMKNKIEEESTHPTFYELFNDIRDKEKKNDPYSDDTIMKLTE